MVMILLISSGTSHVSNDGNESSGDSAGGVGNSRFKGIQVCATCMKILTT